MKGNQQVIAQAATKEEIWNNVEVWLPKAKAAADREGRPFFVSWDNATTHAFADRLQLLGLRPGQYLKLPARSPDLHQIIEHPFSQLKTSFVGELYRHRWEFAQDQAVDWVLSWCKNITGDKIRGNLQLMPKLYLAVSTPKGQTVYVDDHAIEGTGGYYTKHSIS